MRLEYKSNKAPTTTAEAAEATTIPEKKIV
jgi:hypothetical protein